MFFISLIILLNYSYGQSQNNTIDSLELILKKDISVKRKIDASINLYLLKKRNHLDSAFIYLEKASLFVNQNINDSIKVELFRRYAEYYLDKHNYDSTFIYVDKALKVNKNPILSTLVDVYSINGTALYYKGDYEKAIESHLKASKISDTLHLDSGKARVFNNIGISFIKLEDWIKAEEYMKKSLAICKKHNIKRGISYTLGNLGIILRNQKKYDEAKKMYQESIKINEELNDLAAISRNFDNLGSLNERLENFAEAKSNYEKAIYFGEKSKNYSTLAISHHNIASLHTKSKNYEIAKTHYDKSLKIASSLKSKDILRNIYLGMSVLFEKKHEFEAALIARKDYEKWKDSVINSEHLSAISELEIKYETEKKEKEILALSEQKLKDEAALEKQQARIKRLSIGLIGIILLSGLGFIIFRQYSHNKKQQDLIATIADTQIEERKRIAQDLHDSVGGSIALARNKLETLLQSAKEEPKEIEGFLETLSKTGEQIRQISHNMMPGELVKFGLVSAVQTIIDQIDNQSLETNLYVHNLEERIDQTKEIHLFRIIQEIIQNTLKHAKASQLNIYLNKFPKYLSVMVEDNGIGFISGQDSNSGIGLNNIKNRVAYLKGKLNIDSSNGKGTTFNVQIPL